MSDTPRYARWKAPAEDGQVLLWPEPRELLQGVRENQQSLSKADSSFLQGIPLSQVRRRFREETGYLDDSTPIIATGHQTELHHSGVWVKNALIDAVATALNGEAIHFAVDTDEPKHLKLRWPGGSTQLAGDEQSKAAWSSLLPAPPAEQISQASHEFSQAAAAWDFKPVAPQFFDLLTKLSPRWPSLPAALSHSLQRLDESLGLVYETRLVSPLLSTVPYLVFVHHILARARELANDYNQSLEEFRREKRIRTAARPMPNLVIADEVVEAPFWLDDISRGSRERAHVQADGRGFTLQSNNGDRFTFDPQAEGWQAADRLQDWLDRRQLRLAPRALTLTAVLRLLIADGFVHGIGGGEYDQVLDRLIMRHWKLPPPRFAVTTATLFFPSASDQSRVCLPCLVTEGHRLRHNVLGDRKAQLVEAIAGSPRRSHQRAALFASMHQEIRAAASDPSIRQWEARFAKARETAGAQRELFDRELFYAIQPQERLSATISKYRARLNAF